MPSHVTRCIVCDTECHCYDDTHALGCGGDHGEGGCDNPPYIEFCSLACVEELQRRLPLAIANYCELQEQEEE